METQRATANPKAKWGYNIAWTLIYNTAYYNTLAYSACFSALSLTSICSNANINSLLKHLLRVWYFKKPDEICSFL
jgi:hypothetical protein